MAGRRVIDFLAIMPAAVPGIFFGIGYATAFNQRWLDWLDAGLDHHLDDLLEHPGGLPRRYGRTGAN